MRVSALFVIGGARSGKSRHAQDRMEALPGKLAFVATAQAFDAEMADRIARHRADRGARWKTFEAPIELPAMIDRAARGADAVLVDCLTLWLSNLMLAGCDVAAATRALIEALGRCPVPLVLVANEVGMGIVPENALARRFRDEAGRLNQRIAAIAAEVVFVAAGLPLALKHPSAQGSPVPHS
ncbi:adenosylcobinamide kinase /adenosylcobinamide-phosphate guanylyltransferase [Novosphingobium sp. CF614]|uniref:bifunctional adenosylcobinamide kinase/adenosylcobinamide-phosphate guanylyltransferase n=1 Tax=Novosphingobium sp. CF614 TaxID=1884364 RepID=UPI0008ECCA22|nr:bifunctional adenosylcobinamide kinase/adenosylcobinamide-phosphate guanylyltransferase [Novosphingobium sp. CF614]SFG24925.1 adenosylcobinamide kinase /adenosylcobinamide-phosphate guanylyltransferase [Novosphingobium sp. CF614]